MSPHEEAAAAYRQLLALHPDHDGDELGVLYNSLQVDHGLDHVTLLLIGALVGTIHAELAEYGDQAANLEYVARMADALERHTPDDMNPPANPWWTS